MKPIIDFAVRVGAKVSLPANLVVKRENRYFLLSDALKKIVHHDFYYAGLYLGKVKEGKFFPSFPLLTILAKKNPIRSLLTAGQLGFSSAAEISLEKE